MEECYERRQLREIRPDLLKAVKSMETARDKLAVAKELAKSGFGVVAVVFAYASMFHSCRALLFRDGVQEKSHYCVIEYVMEKYCRGGKLDFGLITVMDSFREEREDVMYGLEKVHASEKEIRTAMENAEKLILEVGKIVGKKA